MQISITARHFDLTDSVKDYLESTCEHFSHYFEKIIDVKAIMDYNKSKTENFSVSLSVHCSGNDFRSEAENDILFKAIEECSHKIETQLKKDREKKADHHKAKQKNYTKRSKSQLYKKGDSDENKVEIESNKFFAETMTTDKAIDSLKENNLNYFVYRDDNSGKVNTIIKIDSEHYKIIEA